MDERNYRANRWGRVKVFGAVVALTFAVTFAVMVANRLSNESLAVLIGAVCGVGAAIPTSLLVVAVSRRRDEPRPTAGFAAQPNYPPVVVLTTPGASQQAGGWPGFPPSLNAPLDRRFTVVGGAATDQEVMTHEHYR
ncbi:MAG: hypothetical protein GX601_05790 [Anaerolineales bacterium]|nr:hypothetical protein [Anaerolineales bacterium]